MKLLFFFFFFFSYVLHLRIGYLGKTQRMIIVQCPHCEGPIEVVEVNCAIFRHGVFKQTGIQMHPHETKEKCDELIEKNLIYGCGKPFKITIINNTYVAEICDYI